MKKIIIYISLVLTFILIYLLQVTVFTNVTIAGIMPNVMVVLMLFIGLYMGRSRGVIFGIIFGILIDIWIGRKFGITSVCLAFIGFLAGIFDKNFSKESRITVILMVIVSTILFEILSLVLRNITVGINIEFMQILKILGIEVIYNVLITIIIYPLIRKAGYEAESEIKGNKLFTRYF